MPFWSVLAWAQLREFLRLEQDPLLVEMRARLFQRRMGVLVPATLALIGVQVWVYGLGFWALLFPATLAAWYGSRQAAQPKWVAPVLTLAFLGASAQICLHEDPDRLSFAAIVMMLVPIFGTFTVGLAHGFLLFVMAAAVGSILSLRAPAGSPAALMSNFCLATSFWYIAAALAQMTLYMLLIRRLRLNHVNTARADLAVKDLNGVLSDLGRQGVDRLRLKLEGGLPSTDDLQPLIDELKATRAWLPQSLPKRLRTGSDQVDNFKSRAFTFFVFFMLLVTLVLTVQLYLRKDLWILSAIGAFFLGLTLLVKNYMARWQNSWRLLLLVYLGLLIMDVLVFHKVPPPVSLFFLPLVIYVSSFLGLRGHALSTLVLGLVFLALAPIVHNSLPGLNLIYMTLGICSFIVWRSSNHSIQEQSLLLERLALEEDALRKSLTQYRGLVSALFHDLANPLSVLQSLAQMPPQLRQAEDQERAWRMVDRMEEVLRHRGTEAPPFKTATGADLYHDLWDAYAEALRKKKQQWSLGAGAALGIQKAGPILRDGILGQLLSNAIRFSPPGSALELSVEVRAGGLSLFLRDRGPGLSPAVLEELAHNRMPPVQSDDQGEYGLGLGLLLAQERAHGLGGKLRFRNPPGGGLEAEVWIPA